MSEISAGKSATEHYVAGRSNSDMQRFPPEDETSASRHNRWRTLRKGRQLLLLRGVPEERHAAHAHATHPPCELIWYPNLL